MTLDSNMYRDPMQVLEAKQNAAEQKQNLKPKGDL